MIEKEGEWQLITNNPVDKPFLVRVVRSALELDISAAAKLLRQLPGVIYTGTKVEAAWLKAKLHEVGETAEIRRSK